jgi:hypothetical protein
VVSRSRLVMREKAVPAKTVSNVCLPFTQSSTRPARNADDRAQKLHNRRPWQRHAHIV